MIINKLGDYVKLKCINWGKGITKKTILASEFVEDTETTLDIVKVKYVWTK